MLIFVIGLGAVTANDNSTQTQANDAKTFADIQIAIDNAQENDTIEIEGTYSGESREIQINKSVTISSRNGATLDAQGKSNVFNISNVNVCLDNLNIVNSYSKTASAIYSKGNLTIIDSDFTNNVYHYPKVKDYDDYESFLDSGAGAIYSTNDLNIINCTFENNYADMKAWDRDHTQKLTVRIGGSIYSKRNLALNNSRFKKDNYVVSRGVSSISNSQFIASRIVCFDNASIINSTFSKNINYTSAIKCYSNLAVIGCNFTDNGGYVIYSENFDADEGEDYNQIAKVIVDGCNFINNNAKSAGCYNPKTYDEYHDEFNTIFCEGTDIDVCSSNFVNNTSNAISVHWATAHVLNSRFTNNSGYRGGAIDSYNLTVINSTFDGNYAKFAGAIYSDILELVNCSFTSNNEGALGIAESGIINNKTYDGVKYFNNSLTQIRLLSGSVVNLKTTYESGKKLVAEFFYTESKNPLKNEYVNVEIVKGKNVDYDDVKVNSKGKAYFEASKLAVGTYKIKFNQYDDTLPKLTASVKITKAKTTVKAPKVTNKYKKSRYFKLTVKNKASKKAVKNTYVKLKIAKKTYKIKTNSKGVAKFNTKKLKVGKHAVKITSGNANYIITAKSTITIKC